MAKWIARPKNDMRIRGSRTCREPGQGKCDIATDDPPPDFGRDAAVRSPDVSVVVPLYNEEDSVGPLHRAVTDALVDLAEGYELVLVDDGSSDATLQRATALVGDDPRVRVVALRRNFGQTAAMAAGIRCARGRTIVTMDGDLQNDPRDIPALIALLEQGFDLATGWRRKRQDHGLRVAVSKAANRIMNHVMGVDVRDSGCSLKAYRAELIQSLPLHGEMHRFIPALSQLAGARVVQIEVRHHARRFGHSKYGFSRIYKVMLDIVSVRFLLSFSAQPVRTMAWPVVTLLVPALLLFAAMPILGIRSITLISLAFALLATVGFLACWGLVGLIMVNGEPHSTDFARIGARMWRNMATHDGLPK